MQNEETPSSQIPILLFWCARPELPSMYAVQLDRWGCEGAARSACTSPNRTRTNTSQRVYAPLRVGPRALSAQRTFRVPPNTLSDDIYSPVKIMYKKIALD